MDKLTLNIPVGTEITPELVEMNIGISKDFNVFELQKAIGRKDIYKSNQIMNHFASNPKENPLIMTISILFSFFSKLMLFHSSSDKSRTAVASLLSVNPFFVNDYIDAAKNYSSERIQKIISLLREYDMKAKGVENITTEESELMREMLWKIIH
jgi:DNA polymerase III subunit delta